MTVVRVKPVSRKLNVFNDFDRIFDEFFNTTLPVQRNGNGLKAVPAVNIIENGDTFRLELAAPGLEKNDFKVDVEQNVLRIEVNKEFKAEEGETYKRCEFGYFDFMRSFRLPETIDANGIEASYVNGILVVHLPKKEDAKVKPPRTIKIG